MATCKDCFHVEVCGAYLAEPYKRAHLLAPDPEVIRNLRCDDCEFFKDRSRFVELPCKVGETVYRICPVKKGEGCSYCPWEYCECHDIGFQNDRHNSIRNGKANDLAWIIKRIPYFGKVYFTTPEEAEQALKEREKNC